MVLRIAYASNRFRKVHGLHVSGVQGSIPYRTDEKVGSFGTVKSLDGSELRPREQCYLLKTALDILAVALHPNTTSDSPITMLEEEDSLVDGTLASGYLLWSDIDQLLHSFAHSFKFLLFRRTVHQTEHEAYTRLRSTRAGIFGARRFLQ
ncbi:hypothetical protein GALMADRAFT_147581 [Galerina marginata CBS 339.88]|uniref:Uncharacterized protein n=1 Tax=Galerina marginata (strain CBS 339.88) TaxID=685588 RepID=A0A067SGW7_GALM3|nr:hypothetical protein GALMADRAFT_147581 [Galerina marginata CBS 339.88]